MTIFSILIIGILINFFRKGRKISEIFIFITAWSIALEIMVSVGYFVRIGNFEIGYSEFLIITDTLIAAYMLITEHRNRRIFLGVYCWCDPAY